MGIGNKAWNDLGIGPGRRAIGSDGANWDGGHFVGSRGMSSGYASAALVLS